MSPNIISISGRDDTVLHVPDLKVIAESKVIGNRGIGGSGSQEGGSHDCVPQAYIIHGRLVSSVISNVSSTDAIGAGNPGGCRSNYGREADLAVTPGTSDADVVVLVGQMEVVGRRGGSQASRGARVPVETGNRPCNINISTSSQHQRLRPVWAV